MKWALFLLVFNFELIAEEVVSYEYHIDSKYEAGNNLLYDCHKKHFICINDNSFTACEEKRADEILKKEKKLSCIPIKKFNNKNECVSENYRLMYGPVKNSLCKGD